MSAVTSSATSAHALVEEEVELPPSPDLIGGREEVDEEEREEVEGEHLARLTISDKISLDFLAATSGFRRGGKRPGATGDTSPTDMVQKRQNHLEELYYKLLLSTLIIRGICSLAIRPDLKGHSQILPEATGRRWGSGAFINQIIAKMLMPKCSINFSFVVF